MKVPTGFTLHRFQFQNIKLWEIPLEVLKEQKLPGLLPLLPLTKDGDRREVVEEVIEGLEQAGRTDLLPLAYVFSAYTFDGENVQQWLIERFNTMKDLLEDNWAYREMVKWAEEKSLKRGIEQGVERGLKQGKKEALEQIVICFVETHFPDLTSLAKQQAALIKSSQQLQKILNKLFVAHTDNEARAALLDK
jgi:flagellar biosynthesis/type III secretory pathway protein FliH